MAVLWGVLYVVVWVYVLVLFGRVVLDIVRIMSRDWRPTGFWLVVAEAVYGLTDPPLRVLRKVIPPLSLGRVRLDLGFMVLLLGCYVLMAVLRWLSATA
ncbi:MAG: YggT family protein [Cellulomonadaceae bacterium]